jgi:hypothetical protein
MGNQILFTQTAFGPLRLWTTANASLSFDFPYMVAWVEEQES